LFINKGTEQHLLILSTPEVELKREKVACQAWFCLTRCKKNINDRDNRNEGLLLVGRNE
jgi:hypothetical protein